MGMQHKGTLGNQRIPACIVMWPSWCNLEHGDRSIDRVLNRCLWVPSVPLAVSHNIISDLNTRDVQFLPQLTEQETRNCHKLWLLSIYSSTFKCWTMSKQEMAAGYAWAQTLSGSGQWDVKVSFGGEGGKILTLTCSPPPTWACISLQQNHTNTHRSTSLCTGFKNISSIQRGQIALLPTISLLHSQLSRAAHYTHNLNTETVCCKVF